MLYVTFHWIWSTLLLQILNDRSFWATLVFKLVSFTFLFVTFLFVSFLLRFFSSLISCYLSDISFISYFFFLVSSFLILLFCFFSLVSSFPSWSANYLQVPTISHHWRNQIFVFCVWRTPHARTTALGSFFSLCWLNVPYKLEAKS